MNFFRSPFFLSWLYPQLHWRVPTLEKEIYLTFDDGPVPGVTEFVLEELKKAGAGATFFCIGDNVKKHPEVFKKILEAGHATANHTFNHLSGWRTKKEQYVENVKQCDLEMSQHQGTHDVSGKARLFRPPYGRIKRSQIRLLKEYQIVMWDVLTHDYAKSNSPENCLEGSVRATRPGSIVVFHDSYKAEKNLRFVLPRFISHFRGLGFTFKALP